MARPKKTDFIDLTQAHDLTDGLIERLICRADIKAQAFLRDSKAPGLRVRFTNTGAKSFVFEAELNRQTIRRTIGDARAWTIEAARVEANRLRVTLDAGSDPREVDRQQQAEQTASKAAAAVRAVTVGVVWTDYMSARKPHWGERHYLEHGLMVSAGGAPKRAGAVTAPGILHPLMGLALRDLVAPIIEAWAAREAQTRPAAARLAWRCLKAFFGWCAEQPEYAPVVAAQTQPKVNAPVSPWAKLASNRMLC
jgi:hypothetical protein